MTKTRIPLGETLSPILTELEDALWEMEATIAEKPCYTDKGFRGACKIFMSVLLDRMYELQIKENISQEDKELMATKAGEEVRALVKTYTGIDTHTLY